MNYTKYTVRNTYFKFTTYVYAKHIKSNEISYIKLQSTRKKYRL